MPMIVVTPAYGRDYPSAAKAKSAWVANLDFILQSYGSPWDGKPINAEQASKAYPGCSVQIRYQSPRRQTILRPGYPHYTAPKAPQ